MSDTYPVLFFLSSLLPLTSNKILAHKKIQTRRQPVRAECKNNNQAISFAYCSSSDQNLGVLFKLYAIFTSALRS